MQQYTATVTVNASTYHASSTGTLRMSDPMIELSFRPALQPGNIRDQDYIDNATEAEQNPSVEGG